MTKLKTKLLHNVANIALKASTNSAGFASCGFGYEPEMTKEARAYKAEHVSKMEKLYNKLVK